MLVLHAEHLEPAHAPRIGLLLAIDGLRFLCAVALAGTFGALAVLDSTERTPKMFRGRARVITALMPAMVLMSAVVGLSFVSHDRTALWAAMAMLGPVGAFGMWLHTEWLSLSLLLGQISGPSIAMRELGLMLGMLAVLGMSMGLGALLMRLRGFTLRQLSALGGWPADGFAVALFLVLASAFAGSVGLLALKGAGAGIDSLLAFSAIPDSLAAESSQAKAHAMAVLCVAFGAIALWRHVLACRPAYR